MPAGTLTSRVLGPWAICRVTVRGPPRMTSSRLRGNSASTSRAPRCRAESRQRGPGRSRLPGVLRQTGCARRRRRGSQKVRKARTVKVFAVEGKVHVFKARFAQKLLPVLPVGAQLVVELPFFRIFQHFVGFVDFLKFFFGLLVAGVEVRVVFAGQLFVGPGNVLGLGSPLYAQKFVIILVRYWPCLRSPVRC